MRDIVTGGTVFWLDDNVDGGPIAAQEWCWIRQGDTASELWRDALFPLGLALTNKVLPYLENDRIVKIPQDETVATFEPAVNPPRLFRPELPQLASEASVIYEVESDLAQTLREYSVGRR